MSSAPIAVGYIVLTKGPDGRWHDDWDGEVHPSLRSGKIALREARESNEAILVGCYEGLELVGYMPKGKPVVYRPQDVTDRERPFLTPLYKVRSA